MLVSFYNLNFIAPVQASNSHEAPEDRGVIEIVDAFSSEDEDERSEVENLPRIETLPRIEMPSPQRKVAKVKPLEIRGDIEDDIKEDLDDPLNMEGMFFSFVFVCLFKYSVILVFRCSSCTLFWDVILGHKFVMVKSKQASYWSKTDFFSVF